MVTGSVGLEGVVDAFDELDIASPNTHAKIMVVPGLAPHGSEAKM